ncbi:hypothetical protein CYLTODRAFT_402376 [Cylindrobasidium torrendii FP15055 ss-10]|uniref:ferric-chelate reductase (NADPH) n=1 Tax=Cylindrobasidium torrendii FP15055 ss-10 TaxID=1314674 RepID=A0A0D7B0N9_9AGAR|nr:hypothetical protein CYLTODRAFT_402376 [Cylindrobasidium torrendii FP15055 ss-10]
MYNPEDLRLRAIYADAYPHQIWFLVASFISVVGFCQLVSYIIGKHQYRRRPDYAATTGGLSRIPLAIVNVYRVVAFRSTIGIGSYSLNLAEVFCTVAYIAALFTWELVNTTDVKGNKFSSVYVSGRAGAIATSQFPLVVALGTKNNLVSLVTGVSYDKLNYLHRMTARVGFIMLWVHGGLKLPHIVEADHLKVAYIWPGFMGLIALTLLVLLSIRPIRQHSYEFFFYAHFALVLIFLVGAYYHARRFEFEPYVLVGLGIWALDRLIRVLRVLVFNHFYFLFHKQATKFDARVELLSEHFVRLTIKRPNHFHWAPGQTAYLILPGVSRLPWEAHPFTIASFDSSSSSTKDDLSSPNSPGDSSEKDPASIGTSTETVDISGRDHTSREDGEQYLKELVFLVNVREGFTKRLAKIGVKKGNATVFIDGPYGPSPVPSGYDTAVFVSGGSGVSYTLPLLLDTIERTRAGSGRCRKAVFIWAIRDNAHLHWISDALNNALHHVPTDLEIEIRIFVTGTSKAAQEWDNTSANGEPEDLERKSSKESTPSLASWSSVQILNGRPELDVLLKEATTAAAGGKMGVFVCGSSSVAQATRRALSYPIYNPMNVASGGASVSLHVESFGYA